MITIKSNATQEEFEKAYKKAVKDSPIPGISMLAVEMVPGDNKKDVDKKCEKASKGKGELKRKLEIQIDEEFSKMKAGKTKEIKTHGFDCVVRALQAGHIAYRLEWDNHGERFVYAANHVSVPIFKVDAMSSLPKKAKEKIMGRFLGNHDCEDYRTLEFRHKIFIVHPDNTIDGWQPNQSDTMATDWVIPD